MAISLRQTRSKEQMRRELAALRSLAGWYGVRGDREMQLSLSGECWALSVEIGNLEAARG